RKRGSPIRPMPPASTRLPSLHSALLSSSYIRIIGAAAAFRHHPVDVLLRILYVAGFAVDAILRVDLQPLFAARRVVDDLVDAGRTIALFRRVVEPIVDADRQRRILEPEMRRLVLLVIGIGDKDRG